MYILFVTTHIHTHTHTPRYIICFIYFYHYSSFRRYLTNERRKDNIAFV
jgi:hypothetical protein